jgi:hypothetical protein
LLPFQIYKVTDVNGKYYIGRHSTNNIDDSYVGSGLWPSSIKDKSILTREILEYADDESSLKLLEGKYLAENFGKDKCMNCTPDPIGFSSEFNPMKNPEIAAKISGDKHWSHIDPKKYREKLAGDNHWMNKYPEAKERFLENHPNLDGRNAKQAMKNGTHNSITNNPSTINAQNGTHHWQNGKSPNYEGKLNKKLIEEGRHNFLGKETNQKRIDAGTHNFVGSAANLKMLAEGRHPSQRKMKCSCGKSVSVGMYKRWHGDNCKLKETK